MDRRNFLKKASGLALLTAGDGIEALRVAGNIQVKFERKSYDD